MNFDLHPEIEEYRSKVREFVNEHIIPLENDRANYDHHENIAPNVLLKIQKQVKQAGLWAPQMPKERGGLGFDQIGMAASYEEMNRSIFGPVCFNCSAPDDGNMFVLNKVATEEQKDKWLQPIIDGTVRSSFVMTEPHPGSGSDPSMMLTKAEPVGNSKWKISGHKWFITGAEVAEHFILMAKTSDDPRKGLTAFMFHKDQPGWEIIRRIEIMGRFDGLEIDDADRIMEVGDGLKLTQIRLGTARLTHCMRWLGLAKRSMEVASEYVEQRESFNIKLADRESVQMMLGGLAADIELGRLITMRAAWKLANGDFARKEVSMAKNHVADTLHRAVDTALQLNGARGYSKDTPLEWIYRYARQARLVDGASEVHKMVLSRIYRDEGLNFWSWGV